MTDLLIAVIVGLAVGAAVLGIGTVWSIGAELLERVRT